MLFVIPILSNTVLIQITSIIMKLKKITGIMIKQGEAFVLMAKGAFLLVQIMALSQPMAAPLKRPLTSIPGPKKLRRFQTMVSLLA
jgi:hypothetical protein